MPTAGQASDVTGLVNRAIKLTVSADRSLSARLVEPGELAFVIHRTGQVEVGGGTLPVHPKRLLLCNSGDRVVVLQGWGQGPGDPVLYILNARGRTVAARSVADLFDRQTRRRSQLQPTGQSWLDNAWIDDELGVVAAISTPPAGDGEEPTPPAMFALSLANGRPVPPWEALANRLRDPDGAGQARALIQLPDSLPQFSGLLPELFELGGELREVAVLVALGSRGGDADQVLSAALADCGLPGLLRLDAAQELLARGDDRPSASVPVARRATGQQVHRWPQAKGRTTTADRSGRRRRTRTGCRRPGPSGRPAARRARSARP